MTQPVVLIGGGGHAKSLLNADCDVNFAGYVDRSPSPGFELPYLGDDSDFLAKSPIEQPAVHIAFVSGPDCTMAARRRIIERYRAYRSATLVAATASIAPGTTLGYGCALLRGAIVNGARLGAYCVVNTGAIVEHDVRLGENVFVGPGAVVCGGVTAGDDCYVGAGAIVRNGVSICSGVTVGMGAVVVRDITEAGTYVGNPARKIR